jgi:flagellar motor switch protein FliN/FliY
MNATSSIGAAPLHGSLTETRRDGETATGPTAQVIALGELPDSAAAGSAPILAESANPLHRVKACLQVCVGEISISVGELLGAREHQVLVLDRGVEQPVDVVLEGKVVARGQLVAVDDKFAVRITELPLPLKP